MEAGSMRCSLSQCPKKTVLCELAGHRLVVRLHLHIIDHNIPTHVLMMLCICLVLNAGLDLVHFSFKQLLTGNIS